MALSLGARADEISIRVPEGFTARKVAGMPDIRFPMFGAFDEEGRLFVAESSGNDLYHELRTQTRNCRISVLEDSNGDGVFDSARVFVDRLVFPMGLAWRDGKLYVADPPDLAVYEDTTGDGVADRREVILTGFGHLDNGSLHGLIFGPDGWLYMTMGWPDGYRLERADGTVLEGSSGALIRCRPDGSDVEVVCRGFANLIEVVFTPRGDVIGTLNWFQKPEGGIRDALVHLVEGGLYPYLPDTGTPQPVTGDPLPAMSLFPAVSVSGLDIYRGTAFPAGMRGNLFSAWFNSRKVVRHVLIPAGATFRSEDLDFVTSKDTSFHPSDVLEAADGSLIVIDTGSWYVQHCPTGKILNTRQPGGVYRVRHFGAEPVADPWGRKVNWAELSPRELVPYLEDGRPVVRDRAGERLARHGLAAIPALESFLHSSAGLTAKQEALWVLANIPEAAALGPVQELLSASEPELVVTAAKVLARRPDPAATPVLDEWLGHSSAAVRMAAAEALAHCGDDRSIPALWDVLRRADLDSFLEHAVVHAVYHLARDRDLTAALRDPHPLVQKAALTLLDHPPRKGAPREEVIARLDASDLRLRETALAILRKNPGWAEDARNHVRSRLQADMLPADEKTVLGRLIRAFQEDGAVQEQIGAALLGRTKVHRETQLYLLEFLAETNVRPWPQLWMEALNHFLEGEDEFLAAAVRVVATLGLSNFDPQLVQLAEDTRAPIEVRLEALRGVISRTERLSPAGFELLTSRLREGANPVLALAAIEIIRRAQLDQTQAATLIETVRRHSLISPGMILPALTRAGVSSALLAEYAFESVQAGWRPSGEALEQVLKLADGAGREELIATLEKARQDEREVLETYEPLLRGGNAERGREVFFSATTACSTCHRVGHEGGVMGPDLTRIGAVRSGPDLLESIAFPSSTTAQGYENYAVSLRDGREVDGIMVEQWAGGFLLREASGAERRIQHDDVAGLERREVSLMPEGLERALSAEDFRDLLAFLQGLK